MQTFFIFQFQIYQNKPYTWLHDFFYHKIAGNYLIIVLYSIACSSTSLGTVLSITEILVILYSSLCLSMDIWYLYDKQLLIVLILFYIIYYYKSLSYVLSILIVNSIVSINIPVLYSFTPLDVSNRIICRQKIPSISLYANTIIYLFLSRLLLLTITSEELLMIIPLYFKPQFNFFLAELKIITILSAQLLNFNYSTQKDILKLLRNRGMNRMLAILPFFFLLKLYLSATIKKTKDISTILYSRNSSEISIFFINTTISQLFLK